MAGAASSLEGNRPPFEEHSHVIDCPVSVLQNLRASVLDRFNSTPHGGDEITGVLFGTREGDEVRITAFRPGTSRGELQKSEALAETERAIAAVLSAAQNQQELAGLEPMGWFRAHPRSDLNLTERDLEIANHLFSQPWQIALVMRPGNSAASLVRFYVREREGPWTADCAAREFTLPAAELHPPLEFAGDAAAADGAALVPAQPPSHMTALLAPPEKSRASRLPAMAVTVLVLAAAVGGIYYWYMRPQPLGLTVRATDSAAQLRIGWDRTARPVSSARAGYVEIADGGHNERLDLDAEQLQIGYVNYPRQSNEVTVHLVLLEPGGGTPMQEQARFVAPAGQPPVETAQNQTPAESVLGAGPEETPELVVPVPVETTEPAARVKEHPKFQPPAAQATRSTAVEEAPAPEVAAPAQVARSAPASLVTPPVHTEPPPEKPAPPPHPANGNGTPANSSAASAPAAARTAAPRAPAAPSSGRVIWIGRLQKNQPVAINGNKCSTGTLMGELPARPFKFSVSPGDLSSDGIVLYTSNLQYANSVVEPPDAQNGWNKTVYTWNPKYANDVSIDEAPAAQNGWNHLVLHSRNPKISVIVIDWTAVN